MKRSRSASLSAVALACSLTTAAPSGQQAQVVPSSAAREIDAFVALLEPWKHSRDTAWRATARLQKLGQPAVAALVARLRQDTFRDVDHGNHSPIQEALEKIGPPAIVEINRVLTPSLLSSTSPDDVTYVEKATQVVGRIGAEVEGAAAILVRVARSAWDPRIREQAFHGLTGGGLQPIAATASFNRPEWETCQGRHWSSCPFDTLSPRIAAALAPLLPEVDDLVRREPDARVRFAAAHVLARWGEGARARAGQEQLIRLVERPGPSYIFQEDEYARARSIEMLGLLGVAAARDVIRAQGSGGSEDRRYLVAEALSRLRDPANIPIVIDLMTAQEPFRRRASMGIAARSQETAFVPALIERLGDQSWNGSTRSTLLNGQRQETRLPIADDALDALRALTFEDFGPNADEWRAWWSANRNVEWRTLLVRFVERTVPQLATAEPWVMNGWMERLKEASDPAVLPFVTAYLRHPRLAVGVIGPNRVQGGGGPPHVVTLLAKLVGRASPEARQLLYECLSATKYPLSLECPGSVASFDPGRAAERLVTLLNGDTRSQAAEALLQLEDSRGILPLIELLASEQRLTGWSAIRLLRFYTQEDIPYDSEAPVEARKAAAEEWRRWWQREGNSFVLKMRAARVDIQCCRF